MNEELTTRDVVALSILLLQLFKQETISINPSFGAREVGVAFGIADTFMKART